MSDISLLPSQIIEQLRAWFFAKDRSIILPNNGFLGFNQIETPSINPSENYFYLYAKNNGFYYLDNVGNEAKISDGLTNHFTNSSFLIDQQGNAAGSAVNATYIVDQWRNSFSVSAGTCTMSRSTTVPTDKKLYSLKLATSGVTYGATNFTMIDYPLEGYYFIPLYNNGFYVSFWAYASLTGTYCVTFRDTSSSVSYIKDIVISSANTWTYFSFFVPAPDIGTWAFDNARNLIVNFVTGTGSTYQTANTEIWESAGVKVGSTAISNHAAVDLYIFEPMLSPVSPIFQPNHPSVDELWCYRYYWILPLYTEGAVGTKGGTLVNTLYYPVVMRTTPTWTASSVSYANGASLAQNFINSQWLRYQWVPSGTSTSWVIFTSDFNARM